MNSANPASQTQFGTSESVDELLLARCREHPDKVQFRSIDQGRDISYRQMAGATNQLCGFLADLALKANDRVVLIGENSLEFLIIACGTMRYGATICPLNVEYQDNEVSKLIKRIRPAVVFLDRRLADRRIDFSGYERVLYDAWPAAGPDSSREDGSPELFARLAAYSADRRIAPVSSNDDLGTIMFTSGTESDPKGGIHTFRGYLSSPQNAVAAFELSSKDVILEYRPYSWASPFGFGFVTTLFCGATVVFAGKFSQSRFFSWVADYKVTVAAGIPAVFNMLLAGRALVNKSDIRQLRFITSSTAPLPASQQKEFVETYQIPIVQLHGSTETGWIAFTPPARPKIGSAGKPAIYGELRIVDDEGAALPAGEIGEIEVRGPQRAFGYLLPDGEIQPFGSRRWRVGDLGYLDDEGYLFVTGRKKDVVIRGGVNIAPTEIDNVLLAHPDIADAAAVGVPDPIYGEELVCFVVPNTGRSIKEQQVLEYCAHRLARFKQPRKVFFVSSIPKTERGKILRRELVAVWQQLTSGPTDAKGQ